MRKLYFLIIAILFQISLFAQVAPTISTQPTNIFKCAGNAGSLSVVASGSATLLYQWKKNNVAISSATSSTLNFASLSITDDAGYVCVVTNGSGTATTDTAYVRVAPLPPSITTQLQPQTICAGEMAVLNVVATGQYLNYQWIRNDTVLATQNSAIYAVGSGTNADNGMYVCNVSNACGSVNSDSALLKVIMPAAIYYQPWNQVVCVGRNATFNIYATGTDVNYQWKKDGIPVSGGNASTLVVPNVSITNEGTYTCAVWNSCDSANSVSVNLSTKSAPTVTAQPYDISVCTHDTITFITTAVGTAPILYHWYFNGLNTGITTNTLTVNNTIPANEGLIYCKISNACDTITSDTARLHIKLSPTILTQPEGRIRCVGDTVSFSIKASGEEPLFYQWRLQGVNISNALIGNYNIPSVSVGSAGTYTCQVTNMCSQTLTDTAILVVKTPPQIVVMPSNNTVCESATLSLSLQTQGTNPLTYQWIHNGLPISNSNTANFTKNNVVTTDAGIYICYINNMCGADTSNPVTVGINALPRVTTNPQDQMKCLGENVTFTVVATGAAPLNYHWIKDGIQIGSATNASYTIAGLAAAHAGTYSCQVYNMCNDTISQLAHLVINVPPTVVSTIHQQTRCAGDTVSFAISGTGGTITYQWYQSGLALDGETFPQISFNNLVVSNSGFYLCEVTNNCGVASTDLAELTVHPGAIVNLGGDVALCDGDSVILASGSFMLYHWNDNMAYTPSITVDTAGTFILEAWNSYSCYGSDTVIISVNTVIPFSLGEDVAACGSYTLDAGVSAAFYQWSNGAPTQTTEVTQTGTYSLVVTAPGGCQTSDTIDVTVNPVPVFSLPNDTTITTRDTLFLAGPGGFTTYLWNNSSNQQNYTVRGNLLTPGSYAFSLKVWNEFGCATTEVINVDLLLNGISTVDADKYFSIFPNPASDKVFLNVKEVFGKTYSIDILNQFGQSIYIENIKNRSSMEDLPIDISKFSKGAYMLRLILSDKVLVKKFVVQ